MVSPRPLWSSTKDSALRLDGANPFWRMILQRKGFSLNPEDRRNAESQEHEDPREPQGRLRRREPGQPALPLLRQAGGRGGPSGHRRSLPRHGGGRDGPCAWPPRVPAGRGRPRHRRAHRRHGEEPQGRGGRRDVRIHADVPRVRPPGARGRVRGDRRVVRDAGQGGEVARRPLREGPAAGEGGGIAPPAAGGIGATHLLRVSAKAEARLRSGLRMKLPIAGQPQQDWSGAPHGMSYDNPRFWDAEHLESELHRVFEICNGCRLCFNLCPSFDVLFRRVDALDPHREEAEGKHLEGGRIVEEHEAAELLAHVTVSTENPVGLLQDEDKERVVELCYECKLCYPKCPYVPPHEFAVDFPRLMLRAKMIGAKEDGIALRERFLGATDLVGGVMTKIAPLANAAAHNGFNRMLMEKTLGIAKGRQLPDYAGETFGTWWARRAPAGEGETKVALFATCFVNFNDPTIGKAAVEVL